MKSSNSFLKDVLNVICSNTITLFGSIVIGLIVPIILGATNYGYYRMFVLYSTYTALLHFGFVDGILLRIGGKNYNSLNKVQFRSNTQAFLIIEFLVSLIIICLSVFINNKIYSFLAITVGINTFFTNMSTYYQFIAQATLNFNGYSIRNAVQSLLNIICTLLMWVSYRIGIIYNVKYSDYISVMLLISVVMFTMCMSSYYNITFGKKDSLIFGFERVVNYCKIGIYLTISYQVSNLLMIIDNQIVSIFFRANIYGEYSFSYSMTNTAVTILGAVATVLLPHLKRDTFQHMISIYHNMISMMMLAVYLMLSVYFPLHMLVKIFLPDYIQSLSYLKIFLPELGITCSVTMITFNYYNALGKSKFYFYVSLIILIISTIIDLAMYVLFDSSIMVALGSFVSIFIWYLLSEYFLVKWYHVQWIENIIYMILMICSFFVTSVMHNLMIGFGIYITLYVLISWIMFKDVIYKNIKNIIDRI